MRKPVFEETMCCGYKRCPTLRVFEAGDVEIVDDDLEAGSIGVIKLNRAQAFELVRNLLEQLQ